MCTWQIRLVALNYFFAFPDQPLCGLFVRKLAHSCLVSNAYSLGKQIKPKDLNRWRTKALKLLKICQTFFQNKKLELVVYKPRYKVWQCYWQLVGMDDFCFKIQISSNKTYWKLARRFVANFIKLIHMQNRPLLSSPIEAHQIQIILAKKTWEALQFFFATEVLSKQRDKREI